MLKYRESTIFVIVFCLGRILNLIGIKILTFESECSAIERLWCLAGSFFDRVLLDTKIQARGEFFDFFQDSLQIFELEFL